MNAAWNRGKQMTVLKGEKTAPSSWVTLKTVKRIKIPFNKQQNLMNIGIAQ